MPSDRHYSPPRHWSPPRRKDDSHERSFTSRRDYDRGSRRYRARSPSRSRSRSPARPRSRSASPGRVRRRDDRSRSPRYRRSRSRSRSVTRRRRVSHSRSRSRSRDRKKRRRDRSASSSSEDESRKRRKGKDKDKERRRSRSRSRERRKDEKKRKKEKKEKEKKKQGSSSSHWGKHGIISEADIFKKTQEFHTWLMEERKINPETITKDQNKKEFAQFVEDYNTATLPHEKYYNMEAFERRMHALRQGEYLPPVDDGYDPQADMKMLNASRKKKPVEKESFLSREQLQELRKVQNERVEAGKMKLLGMEVKQNMGVRMDEVVD
ncbi:hypothetical protein AMATHDRAFT_57581 [Amanita thiersii Skay4041]|uniref:Uncharacterized protein n=1 Tax=Amanita thiersii Skay4041 TaxID=703135 RepID=A0A2A9NWU6_9AGAR|nr:hypothetical protein AMATHDRAFT_57581 [Amanita thiersii Skay4041]